jgi:trimeric autotransporter adhesin
MRNPLLFTNLAEARTRFLVAAAVLGLAYLCCTPNSKAALPPPAPDGGYPGGNTAEGNNALLSLTTGIDNVAVGFSALHENTTGSSNTAVGQGALFSNTTATGNTALGASALSENTTGSDNTATGLFALFGNGTGSQNTASGVNALEFNTGGNGNTATGFEALANNGNAGRNTASGAQALSSNRTGGDNTATGFQALFTNTGGFSNTANGLQSLFSNTTGTSNTATGYQALFDNTTGANNTADGLVALANNTRGGGNTACGTAALISNTTGSNNVAVGNNTGQNLTTGNNNIDIGANVLGMAGEANTIRIGKQGTQKNTLVAGIFGTAVTGSTVVVNSTGKLGVATSSARFKEGIKPMDKASESILNLKPVSFYYKEDLDPEKIPQFGLVAEEVEKVNPDLVVQDGNGKPFTVRYEAVNAMLLNEFLKEHRKVKEQQATIASLKNEFESKLAQQQKQIEALTDTVREVSERVELRVPGRRIANED